jgi:hypothetical protein
MLALEDLLDRLDTARERTLMALEMLPDEALVQPGAIGRWSIADLLSILTAWDAELVTGLMQLSNGKTPERLLAALRQPDIYNAQRHQDAQGRDLDAIFDDFQASRLHLEEWLSGLSERALSDPRHYKALGGEALARLIARATADHEARYLPFLTGFAQRWEATQEDTRDEIRDTSSEELGEVIPLGQIDILSMPGANGDSAALAFPEDDDDDFE